MVKVHLAWAQSDDDMMHEAYFVDDKCVGIFRHTHGGIVQKIANASGDEIQFTEAMLTWDEMREIILTESGWMKGAKND